MNTEHRYAKLQVIELLETCLEKTLGEEDMKLFRIDFDEIYPENNNFEESSFYDYFEGTLFL